MRQCGDLSALRRSDRRRRKVAAAFVIMLSAILNSSPTNAGSVALPQIDSEEYCKELVGKMLNPVEKGIEYIRCINWEARSEREAKPFWNSLTDDQQKHCLKYFTAPKFTSYVDLQGCMSSAIGYACMRGKMKCQAAK